MQKITRENKKECLKIERSQKILCKTGSHKIRGKRKAGKTKFTEKKTELKIKKAQADKELKALGTKIFYRIKNKRKEILKQKR